MKRITYDFTHLTSQVAGETRGISEAELKALARPMADAIGALRELAQSGDMTFLNLPEQDVEPILDRAVRDRARFRDIVVLGIGGSSLGTRAIYRALVRPSTGRHVDGSPRSGARLHCIENVDAVETQDLLDSLDLETTLFNVVTKSGNTIETMSAFFLVRDRLLDRFGEAGYRERMVVTTDPAGGALRALARREALESFDVPPAVGGRYSVLTPVGLYPLAVAGLDVRGLLSGAAAARDNALLPELEENLAALFGGLQYMLYQKSIHDVVFMPYVQGLSGVAEWFVQLWAESLGKFRANGGNSGQPVGPTPIPALGVIDQHSQLQLFMEGPPSKNIVFVELAESGVDLRVPPIREACESLAHIGGVDLDSIRQAELAGVRAGLAEVARPTSTIRLTRMDAGAVGALLMMLEAATALAGSLFGINPFNQPGVELAKRYAHGLLGREKEAHYAERLRQRAEGLRLRQVSI